jgi:hypothetical protein
MTVLFAPAQCVRLGFPSQGKTTVVTNALNAPTRALATPRLVCASASITTRVMLANVPHALTPALDVVFASLPSNLLLKLTKFIRHLGMLLSNKAAFATLVSVDLTAPFVNAHPMLMSWVEMVVLRAAIALDVVPAIMQQESALASLVITVQSASNKQSFIRSIALNKHVSNASTTTRNSIFSTHLSIRRVVSFLLFKNNN